MLILSLPIRVKGREEQAHFHHAPGTSAWVRVCGACSATRCDTLTPVDLPDDDPESPESIGSPLCKSCSLMLPLLVVDPDWPSLRASEVEELWAMVRREQLAEALKETARDAAPTSLEGVEAALRSAQESSAHQGVDRSRRVA